MNWGFELWDQFDNISSHTQKSYDFCDKVMQFYKERCNIENDYANKLKKLAKSVSSKKKDDDEFTCQKGFQLSTKELNDMAGQHETVAEEINDKIIKDMVAFMQEFKVQRKKLLQDAAKQHSVLQNQMDRLDKSKKKYEKAYNDAERATETYKRNDMDVHMAKIDVDKSRNVMVSKQQASDDSKSEYALEVQNAKKIQQEHYEVQMPEIFQQLQVLDERRTTKIKEVIEKSAKIERNVMPIISKCLDGIETASNSINKSEDSKLVIDKYKTGFPIPNDIPFEDLGNMGATHSSSSSSLNTNNNNSGSSGRATVTGKSKKRQGGLLGIFSPKQVEEPKEDFSHLPPNQQRKQLLCKIDSLKGALSKDTQERDALNKMREVYMNNKNLGDPASLDKQLNENSAKISRLEQELQKFESYLSENQCRNASPGASPAMTRRENDYQDSSSSSSNRTSIVSFTSIQAASTTNNRANSGYNSSSNTATTTSSYRHQDSFSDDDEVDNKTCSALYDYEGSGDGSSLPIKVGEVFTVLKDEGDGWLMVKNARGEQGYVPSSYVQIQ